SAGGQGPGGLHHVYRRDLPGATELGREDVPDPRLLQRGRQGRPLRRLGRAGALRDRVAGGLLLAPLRPRHEHTEVEMTAHAQPTGLPRLDLQQHRLSRPGREMIQNRVEITPEAPAIRHKHPGEEVIYVLEGTLEYEIDGRGQITVSAGEALMVPA